MQVKKIVSRDGDSDGDGWPYIFHFANNSII